MQDATRTSEAWAALAGSLVNGLDHLGRRVDTQHFAASNPPKTCGKKRVRRIQIELPFLRQQVRDLELKLKRLKLHSAQAVDTVNVEPKSLEPVLNTNLVENGSDPNQNSVWNNIAERQLKERLRAKQQQTQLKQTHVDLLDMSVELQKLLKKCDENQQEIAERLQFKQQQRYWDFKMGSADEIYADQLTLVTRMRLQMQSQQPSKSSYLTSGLSMGPEVVKWDSSFKAGFILEMQFGTTLPFALGVTADSYWRFFGCGYGMQDVVRHEADLSTGTIARACKIRTDFEGFTSRVGGKYTARRYFDTDGSINIVWAGSGEVEEIGDATFSGMQLHKRGCIKLRRVPRQGTGQQSTSTVVEASFETIPVLHESVEDKEQQTQKFLDAITKSYHIVDKLLCHRMGTLHCDLRLPWCALHVYSKLARHVCTGSFASSISTTAESRAGMERKILGEVLVNYFLEECTNV
ncbi:hypothetical protein V7S43_014186 [Phytophthora oleae]|uniref:Jacalin-type lectin domain-containing protein n=1 Tax=Phytophthora oleae TaxID=2107226 RepID=A0ABD3F6U2_9STRA